MAMPSSIPDTLNGHRFERQEQPFIKFLEKFPTTDQSAEDLTFQSPEKEAESVKVIEDQTQRLLALTEPEQQAVKVIRRFPGSDSVVLANVLRINRNTALVHLKSAEEKGALKSDKESRAHARATLHFWLADRIPAVLVDSVLGNSSQTSEMTLKRQIKSRAKKPLPETRSGENSTASFASLTPIVKALLTAIGQAGSGGITASQLSEITGQKPNAIYERMIQAGKLGFVEQRLIPGYKKRFFYTPTPMLSEIIGQLFPQQAEETQDASVSTSTPDTFEESADSAMPNTPIQPPPAQTTEDLIAELLRQNRKLWQVVEEMAEVLAVATERLSQIDTSLQSEPADEAERVQELLRQAKKYTKR